MSAEAGGQKGNPRFQKRGSDWHFALLIILGPAVAMLVFAIWYFYSAGQR